VYDEFMRRLVGHTRELIVDHPRRMATHVGPVIDAEAWKRIGAVVERAPQQGRVLLARDDGPSRGFFIGPTIVAEVDTQAPLARDEIFGPVLVAFRATSFDHALELANDTDYALTAGILSRSPHNIQRAADELRAGNVYINRSTTGAVVGRQPFGGYGMSGVGSKAGGPDYLLQLLDPRVVTENTLRQGFAPDAEPAD
jgi:RHH-type proline utilization regulon transcriptional repressor/proline dehydrogenase/delta 1-pyrroline-5-carboxylate dehydrogenase